jgi:hypothetical protein
VLVGMDNIAVVIEYEIGNFGNQTPAIGTGQKQNGIDGILHKIVLFPISLFLNIEGLRLQVKLKNVNRLRLLKKRQEITKNGINRSNKFAQWIEVKYI